MVSGRYLLLDRVGSGGMGTVWRATDQLLGRTVAMKEMRLQSRGEELAKQKQRAHREARALARISHPNVINVYDLVDHDEGVWLIMELVDGPSLAEHVAATGPMTPSTVAGVGLQVLAALRAVHAVGTLHRDVKPGNVLLRADGSLVLCDFGIAALAGGDSVTTTRGVLGSPEYIAPERLHQQPVGPASDLFSLGSTLCALLSGRSPFARSEAIAVLHAVAHEEPEVLPEAVAGPLRPLLEALLRKDPAERPSVAEAMEMVRAVTATGTAPPLPDPAPHSGQSSPAAAFAVSTPGSTGGTTPGSTRGSTADTGAPRRRVSRRAMLSVGLLAAGSAVTGLWVNHSMDDGETGAEDREPSAGPEGNGDPRPAPSSSGLDAVMAVPGPPSPEGPSEYWLFTGDDYFRFRAASGNHPVRRRLTRPSPIGKWKGTLARFPGFRDGVDAVLRVPEKGDEYWVFAKERYLRIRVDPAYQDTLVTGPQPISDWRSAFQGLPPGGIDALMRVPDDPHQVWAFSGGRYARVRLAGEEPGGSNPGASGVELWSGTLARHPEFRTGIDAVLPVPGVRNDYWVFAGRRYMKIRVTDVEYADRVLLPPRTLPPWSAVPLAN
ncbi:protein kinase domain-containing protein [Streptomyces oceani]|uniref:protein kinase domain-containing protein n=1 Tax=Streptomyces oceani TaxID=1075402 RepID=UPI000872C271|nr:protein kinase [Streptomyces oceani]